MLKLKLMPVMLFLSVALSMSATDVGTFSGGSGTKDDPFRITKRADLVEIQSYLHYGTTTYEGYFFRMENDLRFNSYRAWPQAYRTTASRPLSTATESALWAFRQ